MTNTTILVVGGHDSSGGAGVDVDATAALAFGCEVLGIVTAYTVQDAAGVHSVDARNPEVWLTEARAALAEGPIAVKFGLLPGAEHVHAAVELVQEAKGIPVVVDPVIASSSGHVFLDDEAILALRDELLALGVTVTPNIREAALLTGMKETELADGEQPRVDAARRLTDAGAGAVLLKGGHGKEDPVLDLVFDGTPHWHTHPRVEAHLRGTGCRYATALAVALGAETPLAGAAARAALYVTSCMKVDKG